MDSTSNLLLSPQFIDAFLKNQHWSLAGKMARLALWAGLSRNEILNLSWENVTPSHILLPNRQVPLESQLAQYLQSCPPPHTGTIILSQRTRTEVTPQGASHAFRAALNECGNPDVRLVDFRNGYIIGQLQTQSIAEVGRRTGLSLLYLQSTFGMYICEKKTTSSHNFPREELRRLLEHPKESAAHLALALAWQTGFPVQTMATITWEQVPESAKKALGWTGETGYVLVGPKAGKPLPTDRISRITRQLLCANGLDTVKLRDVIADHHHHQSGLEEILDYFTTHTQATTVEISKALGLEQLVVYRQLLRLVQQGKLVRVGVVYYRPGQVVAPAEHMAVLQGHLNTYGAVLRKDVVELLGVTANQASVLLRKWVAQGVLSQEGQVYYRGNASEINITVS